MLSIPALFLDLIKQEYSRLKSPLLKHTYYFHLSYSFCNRPLPGADVRGGLFRVCSAVVLPPSLRGMQAVCVRWLWWQQKPVLLETRVPELVCDGKE